MNTLHEHKSWTIGKIDASPTPVLDQRVEDLIRILGQITVSIQSELDYIYDVVEQRMIKEGKA